MSDQNTPEQPAEEVTQTETNTETPDGTKVEQTETQVTPIRPEQSTEAEGKTNQPEEEFKPQVVSANDVIDEANERMQGGSAEDN